MFAKMHSILKGILAWRKTRRDIPPLIKDVETAKQEWLHAKRMYCAAVEPELIDYAIYLIKASEIKYNYLLRRVKLEGLKLSPDEVELFHNHRQQINT